jgi:hypothetical protein
MKRLNPVQPSGAVLPPHSPLPRWTIVVREPVRGLVALGVFVDGELLDGIDELAGECEGEVRQCSFRATSPFSCALPAAGQAQLTSPNPPHCAQRERFRIDHGAIPSCASIGRPLL